MGPEERAAAEADVRRLCERGAYDEATTAALGVYGREVLRYLCAAHESETDASEIFSVFAEDLWKGLPGFAWECSLRTWSYTLARRAAARVLRQKWRARAVLGSSPAISQKLQDIRTETLAYLRTETKTRLRALRDSLDEDDRALLMLRIDRGLAWDELARVFADSELDAAALKREAARLRKRFQLVKEKLRDLAQREGLVPPKDGED